MVKMVLAEQQPVSMGLCQHNVLIKDTSAEDALVTRSVIRYENGRVKVIGDSAFQSSKALTSVSFPNATDMRSYAFNYCSALVEVNVPKVELLANGCLTNCTALEVISLPAAKTIYNYSFSNCTKLRALLMPGTVIPTVQASVFTGTKIANKTGYIYVRDDLVSQYKTATNWSALASQIRPISEWEG